MAVWAEGAWAPDAWMEDSWEGVGAGEEAGAGAGSYGGGAAVYAPPKKKRRAPEVRGRPPGWTFDWPNPPEPEAPPAPAPPTPQRSVPVTPAALVGPPGVQTPVVVETPPRSRVLEQQTADLGERLVDAQTAWEAAQRRAAERAQVEVKRARKRAADEDDEDAMMMLLA